MKSGSPECSGICRIVLGLARHGGSFGYETSVLFLGDGPLVAAMKDAGIRTSVVAWTGTRRDLAGAWRLWSWLRKHPAQVVHLHHGGVAARILSRMAGARAVVRHVHGRVSEASGALESQPLDMRAADAVIACSEAVAACVRGCRAEVIYAGVETGAQPPAPPSAEGPLKLGVLARLIPLKNVEAVIEATAQLADRGVEVQAEIAGSGPSESSLRTLAARLGVTARVSFLGWHADVARLLASWDLLVIPSLEEGFGLSALEAMAAARPVVASRVGGLGELVVDGVTGRLLPPGDTDALVACLAELAGDRPRLARMGVEGWKRAQTHFSSEQMARRTAALYDQLLDRRSHRTA